MKVELTNKELADKIKTLENSLGGSDRKFKGTVLYYITKNVNELREKYEPAKESIEKIVKEYQNRMREKMNALDKEDKNYNQKIQEIELNINAVLNADPEVLDILNENVKVEFKEIQLKELENVDLNYDEMQALYCMIQE